MKKIVSLLLCVMLLVGLCFALASCQCEHEYGDPVVTQPTCTADGKNTYTCTKCGETKEETPENLKATGHSADEGTVTTEPTCAEAGVKTISCSVCLTELSTEPVDALGHTVDEAVLQTDGVTHYNVCSVCNEKQNVETCEFVLTYAANTHYMACVGCASVKENSTADHTFGEAVVKTPATCDDDGKAEKTCTVCQYVAEVSIPAVGHTLGSEQTIEPVAGSCMPGMVYQECSVCQEKVVVEWKPSDAPHKFSVDSSALSNNCVAEGSHTAMAGTVYYVCSVCESSFAFDTMGALTFDNGCTCGVAVIENGNPVVKDFSGEYLSLTGIVADNQVVTYLADGGLIAGMTSFVVGCDVSMPEAGMYKSGGADDIEVIFKINGNWLNPKLYITSDGVIKFNGNEVGTVVYGEFTNIVLKTDLSTDTKVIYQLWINGAFVGEYVIEGAPAGLEFGPSSNTYMQWKMHKVTDATTAATERGMLIDNIFRAAALPEGFAVPALSQPHTCEAEAGAALQYDENGHYNVCKTCGEPMNVTPHTLGEEKTETPEAGSCASVTVYQDCDCGYKKVIATAPSNMQHKLSIDSSAISTEHTAGGTHSVANGTIRYVCSVCEASFSLETAALYTFDNGCTCGVTVIDNGNPVVKDFSGEYLSLTGVVADNQVATYLADGSHLSGLTSFVVGCDISMPEAGLYKSGGSADMELIFKINGNWLNPKLFITSEGVITLNGNEVGTVVYGEFTNIVLKTDLSTDTKVIYQLWINGAFAGEYVAGGAPAGLTFGSSGNTYMQWKMYKAADATTADTERGMLIDNIFRAEALPEGFVVAE